MKKNLLIASAYIAGLSLGFLVVQDNNPKIVMGHTIQQNYMELSEIEEESELIVSGHVISQETLTFLGGRNKDVIRDAITKSQFEISIVCNDPNYDYKKGDILTVYEPAGIVEEFGQDTYFTSDGYRLTEEESEYFLFLADANQKDEFTINGYQGKFNIDHTDKKEKNLCYLIMKSYLIR